MKSALDKIANIKYVKYKSWAQKHLSSHYKAEEGGGGRVNSELDCVWPTGMAIGSRFSDGER